VCYEGARDSQARKCQVRRPQGLARCVGPAQGVPGGEHVNALATDWAAQRRGARRPGAGGQRQGGRHGLCAVAAPAGPPP
jgi:hypothetical protein